MAPESSTERTRLGGVAALLAAIAFVAVAGGPDLGAGVVSLPGIAVGAAVLVAWFLVGGVYAFALGQVGVASLLAGATALELAAVELCLLGTLLAPVAAPDRPGSEFADSSFAVRPALLALAWVLAGGALSWASAQALVGVPLSAVLLVAATGLAAYGLHRYQVVSLETAGGVRE